MAQLLSTLCLVMYIVTGSFTIYNGGLRNAIYEDMKNDTVMRHNHDVANGEYPFVVALVFIEGLVVTRHCTGSLIHSKWVLSSAHCFYDLLDRKFYVWYGNYTASPLVSKLFTEVINIHIPPDFLKTKFTERGFFFGDNDISLLNIRKIILPAYGRLSNIDHSKMNGLPVKYVGGAAKYLGNASKNVGPLRKKAKAGLIKSQGEQFKPLQVSEGIVVTCGMELTMWSKYVLCVVPTCSDRLHQPLHGDFGGPFIYDSKIVGVMSLSFKFPKTFVSSNGLTPVSPYKEWIARVTRPGNNKDDLTLKEKLDICEEKVEACNNTNNEKSLVI